MKTPAIGWLSPHQSVGWQRRSFRPEHLSHVKRNRRHSSALATRCVQRNVYRLDPLIYAHDTCRVFWPDDQGTAEREGRAVTF